MQHSKRMFLSVLLLAGTAPPVALANPTVERLDAGHVQVSWDSDSPKDIYISKEPEVSAPVTKAEIVSSSDDKAIVKAPREDRSYFLLRDASDGTTIVTAERVLPLEQGSNFRDMGGYQGADGKRVVWGRIFRSGAVPMLSGGDYAYLAELDITAIVDLRTIDERQVAPDLLDDRLGALYVTNDYPIAPLIAAMRENKTGPLYAGAEQRIVPQLRSLFRLLLRDDGAIMFHCSAGQDRTGIAAALILSALGVDRETIVRDYHLSTASRRPKYELPPVDAADFPGNPIVKIYSAQRKNGGELKAQPLYTADGQSHIRMFLEYVDKTYGSVEGFLDSELGIDASDIERLQAHYLE